MKNQILLLAAFFVCTATFAQKDELKAAEKAIKKSDYVTSAAEITKAEASISGADDKTKAKFYYLKGETYAAIAKTDPSEANYATAAESFNSLFKVEKTLGSDKYSVLAAPTLNTMVSEVSAKGIESYQNKNYSAAKTELFQVYNLSPKDTVYLEYAANAAYLDKDFDMALDYFTTLKDLGFTGVSTEYTAKNNDSGERENMGTQNNMDLMVKTGTYSEPKVVTSESKQPNIIKNIAFVYVEKGDTEKALAAVRDARAVAPEDVNLILTEANLQIKLGNKDEFARLMGEALELDPTNASLYFNIGVISGEQGDYDKAKEYYTKCIELDPTYVDGYINLGSALLEDDKILVEEMNQSLNNFDKYDEIKAKQSDLYKTVIPLYEKAYELRPDDVDTIRTLMSLYENTEMDDKFKTMKEKYDSLK
ncbi:tetratricopeptide repeat protein [Lutimonas halocynthiae]|uniref:tetratricopeptide repeat protein n=1 Tax=Lutimonas halocynthiae TaxID=1446477 RepID=UPI0025B565D5|nr:tetratricopeptide repeat protein [Lutimonas halocynthiae]MDN3643823.1 tetratricopeptide repeat protein [Lutimonas halocynthiae]